MRSEILNLANLEGLYTPDDRPAVPAGYFGGLGRNRYQMLSQPIPSRGVFGGLGEGGTTPPSTAVMVVGTAGVMVLNFLLMVWAAKLGSQWAARS